MAKPYSMDLRERAVATVLKEGLSRHKSAARFGVAPSTVINWCGGFKRLAAQRQPRWAGTNPRRLPASTRCFWRGGSGRAPSLCADWSSNSAERGLKADYRSVWNFVHAEKLSLKPSSPANAIGLMSRGGASSGRSARAGSTPSAWCSSTRPGRRPTWSRCAAGRRGAKDW